MPSYLFCPIRKTYVVSTPEERVRQALIHNMVNCLNYPIENIILEKRLNQLPHLTHCHKLPTRRIDIIVMAKGIHPEFSLYPLVLIECKAVPLNESVFRQVIGYNQFVFARFIAVANQTSVYLGYYSKKDYDYIFNEGLLRYETLYNEVRIV